MAKRIFDIVLAGIALTVFLPLFIAISVFIKFDSDGPIFYLGERVGLYGKLFRIYKFRTMQKDAEAYGTTTAKGDPRITRTGRFLRKSKVDELPQLLNILKGEMSFVGPRPEVEEHTNEYSQEERLILSVRPGITDYSSIRFISLDEVLGSDNPHQVYLSSVRAEKNMLRLKYVR